MLAAGLLNEGSARTRAMARFAPSDSPRSAQLYGVDPSQVSACSGSSASLLPVSCQPRWTLSDQEVCFTRTAKRMQVRQAAAWLVAQGAEHIDLNFGWANPASCDNLWLLSCCSAQ